MYLDYNLVYEVYSGLSDSLNSEFNKYLNKLILSSYEDSDYLKDLVNFNTFSQLLASYNTCTDIINKEEIQCILSKYKCTDIDIDKYTPYYAFRASLCNDLSLDGINYYAIEKSSQNASIFVIS